MQNNAKLSEEVTTLGKSLLNAQVALAAAWVWTQDFVVKVAVPNPLVGTLRKVGVQDKHVQGWLGGVFGEGHKWLRLDGNGSPSIVGIFGRSGVRGISVYYTNHFSISY